MRDPPDIESTLIKNRSLPVVEGKDIYTGILNPLRILSSSRTGFYFFLQQKKGKQKIQVKGIAMDYNKSQVN